MGTGAQLKRNHAAGLGLAIGLAGVISYFLWVAFGLSSAAPAMREMPLPSLALWGAGMVLSALAVKRALGPSPAYRGRMLAPLLGAVNLLAGLGFVWFLTLGSALPAADRSPSVGERAPDFSLSDHRGEAVSLAALRGRNVLLVFYRGHW